MASDMEWVRRLFASMEAQAKDCITPHGPAVMVMASRASRDLRIRADMAGVNITIAGVGQFVRFLTASCLFDGGIDIACRLGTGPGDDVSDGAVGADDDGLGDGVQVVIGQDGPIG